MLANLLHLLTEFLDLATEFLDAAFELRCRRGGVNRASGFRLPVSFRRRRSLAASESFGVSSQRIRLVIQSGGPQVLDGGTEMLQSALHFFAFRPDSRAITGALLEHPQQLVSLASQTFRLIRFAGFLSLTLGSLQFLQPRSHPVAVGRRRLQFLQLPLNPFQSPLQLAFIGVLIRPERLQFASDLGGLFLELRTALRDLAGACFSFVSALTARFALGASVGLSLLARRFPHFAMRALMPLLGCLRRMRRLLRLDLDEGHVVLALGRLGPGRVSRHRSQDGRQSDRR